MIGRCIHVRIVITRWDRINENELTMVALVVFKSFIIKKGRSWERSSIDIGRLAIQALHKTLTVVDTNEF